MAEIVFSGVAEDAGLQGTLFQGMRFWLSHKVPQRSRFVNEVRTNGGEVVPLEKQADVTIVDHARKEIPPGSHSYKFIEKSVSNGVLESLDEHRVGPSAGQIRAIGSVIQPAKGTRQKYTADDDRILWDWVHKNPQKLGGTRGNEIYKQLEQKHPHHPWQSWRDRWVKYLEGKPPPFSLPHNAPPTPPSDVPAFVERSKEPKVAADAAVDRDPFESFTEADADALLSVGEDILNIHQDNMKHAWKKWSHEFDKDDSHTPQQWQAFWEEYVRPRYLRRMAKQTRKAASVENSASKAHTPTASKRLGARSPSVFSPFSQRHPEARMLSRSPSYHPESPSMQLTGRAQFQEAFQSPSKKPARSVNTEAVPPIRDTTHTDSPSYQPGTPSMQLTGRALFQEASKSPSRAAIQIPTSQAVQAARLAVQAEKEAISPTNQTKKRKVVALEEEIPSSSPLRPSYSPKRRRQSPTVLPLEIASTPEGSPLNRRERYCLPLVYEYEEEAKKNIIDLMDDSEGSGSPLGQQLSDTLSEPGHRIDDTQAVFRTATQVLSFDVPPPEGGWGDLADDGKWDDTESDIPSAEELGVLVSDGEEELGVLYSGKAEGLGTLVPSGDEGFENDGEWEDGDVEIPETVQHGFQVPDESNELGNDEDSGADASESESQSTMTEIHDRQSIIQETQAILRARTEPPDFTVAEPDGGWESIIPSSPPPIPESPRALSETSSDTDAQLNVWINEQLTEGVTEDQAASVLKSTSMDTELAEEVVKYLAKNGEIPQRRRGVWTELDDKNLQSTDARNIQRLEDKHGKEEIKTRWEFLQKWAES